MLRNRALPKLFESTRQIVLDDAQVTTLRLIGRGRVPGFIFGAGLNGLVF